MHNKYFDPQIGQRILSEFFEQIEFSEEMGFDGINCQEHHGNGAFCAFVPSTTVMAAAIAQRTKRIKIAITGTCLPLHNPVTIAEEVAMVVSPLTWAPDLGSVARLSYRVYFLLDQPDRIAGAFS